MFSTSWSLTTARRLLARSAAVLMVAGFLGLTWVAVPLVATAEPVGEVVAAPTGAFSNIVSTDREGASSTQLTSQVNSSAGASSPGSSLPTSSSTGGADDLSKLPPDYLGVHINWYDNDTDTALDERLKRARSIGASWVRVDWPWIWAESKRGTYDWSRFDRLVRLASANHISILPIVHYAPDWAVDKPRRPGYYEMAPDPSHFRDYAAFVRASVARYGPEGDAPPGLDPIADWEIWNEPNLDTFWGPTQQVRDFVGLMRATSEALKPYRSRIRIVHGGLAFCDVQWLRAAYSYDPSYGQYFDILGVHPGQGEKPPEFIDPDDPTGSRLGLVGSYMDPSYLPKVYNMQVALSNLVGDPGKPIWITEVGYNASTGPQSVSRAEQADYLSRTVGFVRSRLGNAPYDAQHPLATRVERVSWFCLDDWGNTDTDGGQSGLFQQNGAAKPAAEAFRKIVAGR